MDGLTSCQSFAPQHDTTPRWSTAQLWNEPTQTSIARGLLTSARVLAERLATDAGGSHPSAKPSAAASPNTLVHTVSPCSIDRCNAIVTRHDSVTKQTISGPLRPHCYADASSLMSPKVKSFDVLSRSYGKMVLLAGAASIACFVAWLPPMTGPAAQLKTFGLDTRCSAGGCGLAFGAAGSVAQAGDRVGELIEGAMRGPHLLEFESKSCAACKKMAPIMRELESKCVKGHDVVRHVDVVEDDGEALARRYGVRVIPTFVAVDAHGKEVMRLSGLQASDKMAAVISEVTGDDCSVVD
jgi:thiol-disulfide isomerase/thioredoxin